MKKFYLLITACLACEGLILLLIPWVYARTIQESHIGILVLLPLLIVFSLLIFWLVRSMNQTVQAAARKEAEQFCRDLVSERNRSLKEEEKELLRLLEESRAGDTGFQLPEDSYVRYCSHPLADAVLRHKALLLKERKIRFSAFAAVPRILALDDTVLLSVLMNLIDNGADAAARTDHPEVSVHLFVQSGFLVCQVVNSAVSAPSFGRSSKREAGHGLGLSILKEACQSRNGRFSTEHRDGRTVSTAILQLDE